MAQDIFPCHACGAPTHIDLLDAKPSPDDPANWTRFECEACYGPGWEPAGGTPVVKEPTDAA